MSKTLEEISLELEKDNWDKAELFDFYHEHFKNILNLAKARKECENCKTYHYYGQTHDGEKCLMCMWSWNLEDNFEQKE